jgi:glycosyltransferase involved in cell wall biosynthesis
MRIGIVSETYPPEINGVALTVHSLAAGLAQRGHSVDLIRPRQSSSFQDEPGIEVTSVRGGAVPLGWSAMRTARRLGIPVSSGFHTRFDSYADHYGVGLLTPVVRGYLSRFHQRSAATLVPTDALADELRTMGVSNARLLRRAVDTQLFHPDKRDDALRASWGVAARTPVVLYVGRIAAEKNLDLAVQAFRALQKQVPDARYVWVGDGPARAALEAAHPDFIFAGVQRGEALARYFASADMFPFPSLSETFGNVIIEALAAGLPVVAYAEGAAREHLEDGVNGYCIASGNEAAFIDASCRLASNPALIRHMGRAAQAGVAGLSPDSVIRDFEALLREMAEENPHEHFTAAAHA